MTTRLTEAQLTSLEEELRVLRATFHASRRRTARRTFTSLRGAWKGQADFSLQQIRDAEIRLPLRSSPWPL